MSSPSWQFDFDYEFDPDWTPAGSPVRPWFLMGKPVKPTAENYWNVVLNYRPQKVAFVRKQLEGVDRPAALRQIISRVWDGAANDRERFERLDHFVKRMMIHPPIELPLEADAVQTLRRECCPETDHAEPYAEDLVEPWAQRAYAEAQAYGRHIGIWCSGAGQKLTGDWGLRGGIHDALELLLLHEGRCGHQAAVLVQLAQAGGWRARLVQGNAHRFAELMVDGRWVVADTDMFPRRFLPVTSDGGLPTLEWLRDHPEIVNTWPATQPRVDGTAAYYGATESRPASGAAKKNR
jgi:hypothetical protein